MIILEDIITKRSNKNIVYLAELSMDFDWSDLIKLIVLEKELDEEEAKKRVIEFIRFMILKCISKDDKAKIISPSCDIDEIWHLMLLFPCAYYDLCKLIHGSLLDHKPLNAFIDDKAKEKRYSLMKKLYTKHFCDFKEN